MSTPDIPLIDLSLWRDGHDADRAAIAARLDRAMQDSGFFLVEHHGIPVELLADLRTAARAFFALPAEQKEHYRTHVGGRGWLARGSEANAFYGEVADTAKADLKESLTFGRELVTGDAALDAEWFVPNRWPDVPGLEELGRRWMDLAHGLYDDLLRMLATALGLEESYFYDRTRLSPHTFNLNRYPPLSEVGAAQHGQFRVAPHTDWGMLTVLDRQPGYGGLQVQTPDGEWADAPYVEGALTVNIADILARWTADRWRSTRHRVLPPSDRAPGEELISVILFFEADMDQLIAPLPPPVGGSAEYEPVVAADYLAERTRAAAVG
ncbi:isopenicillin N synthase family oxygenase [Nocardioides mangrovicus]|uniref:Isopenicillin N synthase family oxygenase n=1 Tax=Nocardioides mangrovicus TaxID=2478913 RepID=A0A3L8P6Z3_9ACTN|nr:2-oxoglutarate and iron-dependent oxygenase domain-containing protein [Nocardioides mangrovicus]RLV51210.1 isopenicillin N synthase family oxygenase [Nocardioides mangrovicus]